MKAFPCTLCHGVDGRGRTSIGANECLRVPDLHSDLTERMSDGEIHYIIQNGVQLTGMPALQGTYSESDTESWKLVSYIRSFRSPPRRKTCFSWARRALPSMLAPNPAKNAMQTSTSVGRKRRWRTLSAIPGSILTLSFQI